MKLEHYEICQPEYLNDFWSNPDVQKEKYNATKQYLATLDADEFYAFVMPHVKNFETMLIIKYCMPMKFNIVSKARYTPEFTAFEKKATELKNIDPYDKMRHRLEDLEVEYRNQN